MWDFVVARIEFNLPASSLQYYIFENHVHVGVHNILGYLGEGYQISKWDTEYPRILCMRVQNILGYLVGGYNILGGTKYPVTKYPSMVFRLVVKPIESS